MVAQILWGIARITAAFCIVMWMMKRMTRQFRKRGFRSA